MTGRSDFVEAVDPLIPDEHEFFKRPIALRACLASGVTAFSGSTTTWEQSLIGLRSMD